jgi:hypothetical protein
MTMKTKSTKPVPATNLDAAVHLATDVINKDGACATFGTPEMIRE